MNDSKVFQDAESVRSEQSHVPSQPALFPPFRHPGGMHSRSLGMPSRNDKPPDIWDTHGKSANVFVNPTASSSGPYPQESNPWVSNVSEHTSPHVMSQSQTPSSGTLSASRSCSRDDVETPTAQMYSPSKQEYNFIIFMLKVNPMDEFHQSQAQAELGNIWNGQLKKACM